MFQPQASSSPSTLALLSRPGVDAAIALYVADPGALPLATAAARSAPE